MARATISTSSSRLACIRSVSRAAGSSHASDLFSGFSNTHLQDVQNQTIIFANYSTTLRESASIENHWHGATPTTAVTYIAIQEQLDGKVVDWMETGQRRTIPGLMVEEERSDLERKDRRQDKTNKKRSSAHAEAHTWKQ
jgi:hypothetical protein